jgi:ParB-like chromosome segregation protein Spo0J
LELRSSLREYGQVWPILVREDDEIIAGHGRRVAAKLEGFTEIKVLVARGWTEQQCRAFALLDNRIPLNADWDAAKLAKELASLRDDGVKLLDIGFSKGDLARLLPTAEAAARREAAMQSFQPVYQVLIECADEHEQLRVLTKLQEDGINCRALIA